MADSKLHFLIDPRRKVREEVVRIVREIAGRGKALGRRSANEEEIHEGRLLVKRSRAVLWFARSVLGKKAYQQAKVHLRHSAQLLAGPRDITAALGTLEKLKQDSSTANDKKAVAHIYKREREAVKSIESDLETQTKNFRNAIHILCAALSDVVPLLPKRTKWPEIGQLRRKAFRAAKKSARYAHATGKSRDFHEWRKKAKRLFYILELTQEDKACQRKRTELVNLLQSGLGDYHDQSLAWERLKRQHRPPSPARRVLRLLAKRRKHLRKKVWQLQQKLERT